MKFTTVFSIRRSSVSLARLLAGLIFISCGISHLSGGEIKIVRTNYQGWQDSYIMDNGIVEVVVVPAIGRVMQFGFKGEQGVFWENKDLYGKQPDSSMKDWINFGGDKSWPAPEADWHKYTGKKEWCPPPAFDGMSYWSRIDNNQVAMISPVDPYFGVRVERIIWLEPQKPIMYIKTIFHKVDEKPTKIAIWVVTQLSEPEMLFMPVPQKSIFKDGYTLLMKESPPDLQVKDGWISLTRDKKAPHKIGSDADTLIWVGKNAVLIIKSPRQPQREYPDKGSSAEIYTSADPLQYIELETLGQLVELKQGDSIERINQYILKKRSAKNPFEEVKNLRIE